MSNDEFADMPLLECDGQPIPIISWAPNQTICGECRAENTIDSPLIEVLILWHITLTQDVYCKMNICARCAHMVGPEAWTQPDFLDIEPYLEQLSF